MMQSSPVVGYFLKAITLVFVLNRILLTMSVYQKMKIEREEDLFLQRGFCSSYDHRELGRHSVICLQANHRLASSVLVHTLMYVVNDTMYRELHVQTIGQGILVCLAVFLVGAFHTKYLKSTSPISLPVFNKQKVL